MKIATLVVVILALNIFHGASGSEALISDNGPWLRTYPQYIVGLYVDGDADVSDISYKNIYVALSQSDSYRTRSGNRRISLITYAKSERSKLGCLYDVSGNIRQSAHESGYICLSLFDKAYAMKRSYFEDCKKRSHNSAKTKLFISDDLSESRCVASTSRVRISKEIENRVMVESISWSGNGYLNLNNNNLFDCKSYGRHVEYRVGHYDNSHKDFELPLLVSKEQPLWKKKYLIKRNEFSYCWGGRRNIDEPESGMAEPAILNDGTVLLPGVASLLRVYVKTGVTKSPNDHVFVFKPEDVMAEVSKYDKNCTGDSLASGICSVANVKSTPKNLETDFYPYVIEAVDKILIDFIDSPE